CQSHSDSNQQSRCNLNMQILLSAHSKGKMGYTDVPCTRLDQGTTFPPPSFRAHSVPIIPSVQGPDFGEGGRNKLHTGGRGSSSYNLINPETEAELVANSSRSLASSSAGAQDPQTLTCSESALMHKLQKSKDCHFYDRTGIRAENHAVRRQPAVQGSRRTGGA
ncbi:hypothetical protein M9458_024789, partial [Cirrhinus mrigala]